MLADLYLRKSSADGGKSVAQQDEETTDAVLGEGWEVGRRFTDDARSASRYATKGRPDFAALLAHIRAGDCAILAVWDASRASRLEATFFELLEACRDAGTLIYVTTHGRAYDVRKRADWKALAREALDAADYSAAISESSQRGKRKIAMQGKPAGRLLYGYAREYHPTTGKFVRQIKHPEQAAVVRGFADGLLAGKSCSAMARELNDRGVPTAFGAQWRGRDIGRLLRNPAYVRRRIHRGEVLPDVEADWPALLDLGTWEACQRILSAPGRLTHDTTSLRWYLTGVPRCGAQDCTGVLRVHKANGARRYTCYTCRGISVTGVDLDAYIEAIVKARLAKDDAKDLFLPRSDDAEVQAAERDAQDLRDELGEWRALAKARKVSPASFAEFEADLLPKLAAAEARARSLTAPPPLPELEGVDVGAHWGEYSVGTRRKIVRLLMDITVLPARVRGAPFSPERVQINWRNS